METEKKTFDEMDSMCGWSRPTPYEVALSQVDEWLKTHQWTPKEIEDAYFYYGDKRKYGINHLQIKNAIERIRSLKGKPPVSRSACVASGGVG